MLRSEGSGVLLRAVGERGLLRDGAPFQDVRLRLPLEPGSEQILDSRRPDTDAAWREFHAQLRSFVASRVRHAADAEDIVQRVFLQMHRTLPSLRDTDRLGAWLYQVSRNAITDYFRAPAFQREVAFGDTRDLDRRNDSDQAVEDLRSAEVACAAECLRATTARLAPPFREAIEQVEFDGLSQRAAAQTQGISLSGMKARVQRARRKLKALLLEHCTVTLDSRGGVVACEGQQPCARGERAAHGQACSNSTAPTAQRSERLS